MSTRKTLPLIHSIAVLMLFLCGAGTAFGQQLRSQTDWSGGPGEAGPRLDWQDRFENQTDISWRSIQGQISLSSIPRQQPIQELIANDADLPSSVATGDLDGDGVDEIITTDPLDGFPDLIGYIYYWKQDANGAWVQRTVDSDFYGAEYASAYDVDQDGDLDVIACAYYGLIDPPPPPPSTRNGRYAWFENLNGDASSWQQHLVGELFWGASRIDAGDIDGDGDIDLVGSSELTRGIYEQEGDIVWFENFDGAGTDWLQHDIDGDFPNATEAHLGDLDGDGDLDIIGAQYPPFGASQFHWWQNASGDGSTWIRESIPFTFRGAGYLDVGDIDGDGDLDLIGTGLNSSQIGFWENLNGDASDWIAWFVGVMPKGVVIELADVDGDGDLDAMGAARSGNETGSAYWFENLNGNGLIWNQRTIRTFLPSGPWISAGDVNGDGRLDAVVAAEAAYPPHDEQVTWYDLTTFRSAGELTSSILDGGASANWINFGWDAHVPQGTALILEVRASNDMNDLGPFVSVSQNGENLSGLIDPTARYFQYRVFLSSANPEASPVVHRVKVNGLVKYPEIGGVIDTFAAR